ncbi:MAG: hypothetical protein ACUBOA_12650 [Candidatus Loosdrechtia sp.]|uniref:hypothetical protein n=1 Tax=Candidatus Loosdrechtia sp. TaxID=3101272 RepID=UPI003A754E00|nr:MAG: hypothetical protein QY305_12040 [Candidatus Jettenia sp. AMX2]
MQRKHRFILFVVFLSTFLLWKGHEALAHHGGGISTAFGPGAPIETSSPLAMGRGRFLLFERFEYVPFIQKSHAEPENVKSFIFANTLIGYGLTDALSLYANLPLSVKKQDTLGTSKGFGDLGFMVQYGFKLGVRDGIRGLYSFGPEDTYGAPYTLDDLKMSFFAGFTVPTGSTTKRDREGDPFELGMQPGFGSPSFTGGFAASRQLFPHFTLVGDTSLNVFSEYDGEKAGTETRFNVAGVYQVYEDMGGILSRVDIIGESNLLYLKKDVEDKMKVDDSGGLIHYLSPGVRFTFRKYVSIGALIKFPVWKDLNQEASQQGGEGLEKYRAIVTASISF